MDRTLTFGKQPSPGAPTVDLTVVMPCFNEGDSIEQVIRNWADEIARQTNSFEILVINDGSTDGTGRTLDRLRREMKNLRVIHQLNAGHGRSIRRGYEVARGRYILQVDPNGSFDASDFSRLWEEREAALVLAQRTRRTDSLMSQLLAFFARSLANLLFGTQLKDPNVALRLYRREILFLNLRTLNGCADSLNYLLALRIAADKPNKVREVPVPFRPRHGRRRHLAMIVELRDWFGLCRDLVRYRVSAMPIAGNTTRRPAIAGI